MATGTRPGQDPLDDKTLDALSQAMSHQLRTRLLHALAAEPGSAAEEVSEWLDEPLPTVRRHLRALVDAGLIEVKFSEERRGARKFYFVNKRTSMFGIEDDAKLDDRVRRLAALGTLRNIFEDSQHAVADPSFGERHDYLTANVIGKVDERGWSELSELLHRTMHRAMEIVEESGERLRRDEKEETPIPVISALLLLQTPERSRPDSR